MRRLAFVCLLLTLLISLSLSQSLTALGIKYGLNLATFNGSSAKNFTLSGNDPKMSLGYDIGAFGTL